MNRLNFLILACSTQIALILPTFAQQTTYICNGNSLRTNVRLGDSANKYGIITSLPNGVQVTLLRTRENTEGHQWSEISFRDPQTGNMREGWVHAPTLGEKCSSGPANSEMAAQEKLIAEVQRKLAEQEAEREEELARTIYQVEKRRAALVSGNCEQVKKLDDAIGKDSQFDKCTQQKLTTTISAVPPLAQQSTFICNGKSLLTNVRAGDSAKNFGIVTSLGNGQKVDILQTRANAEGHQWSEIRFKDPQSGRTREGWVHAPTLNDRCGTEASSGPAASLSGQNTVEPIDYRLVPFGERLAKTCVACHTIDRIEERSFYLAPHLGGLFSRKIASFQKYNYTETIEKFKSLDWTPQRARSFISRKTIISANDSDRSRCEASTVRWHKINRFTGKPENGPEYDMTYDQQISAIVEYLRTIN